MVKVKYKGIYGYKDIKTGDVVYIGKDSYLYKKHRHYQHHSKTRYERQKINQILQSNPRRYEYIEIIKLSSKTTSDELDVFEMRYIELYKPKFNFTIGGDGAPTNKGKKFTKAHRIKISKALQGTKRSEETKEKISKNNNRHNLGKHLSEETKRRISESQKDKEITWESRLNMSKSHNKSGYYRVYIQYDERFKQGFQWVYKWRENGKQKQLSSVNLIRLASKVKSKGLPWLKLS